MGCNGVWPVKGCGGGECTSMGGSMKCVCWEGWVHASLVWGSAEKQGPCVVPAYVASFVVYTCLILGVLLSSGTIIVFWTERKDTLQHSTGKYVKGRFKLRREGTASASKRQKRSCKKLVKRIALLISGLIPIIVSTSALIHSEFSYTNTKLVAILCGLNSMMVSGRSRAALACCVFFVL